MNNLIAPPKNVSAVVHKDGDTQDIIDVILYADKHAANDTVGLANNLQGQSLEETCKNVYSFIHGKIKYVADVRGHERVKSPAKTWSDRKADCKSMSIFAASILQNLNIPYAYRFASYTQSGDYTHVYVLAGNKKNPIVLDATLDTFDHEVSFVKKKDYWMTKISYLSGAYDGRDIPKVIAPKRFVNYIGMSDGELKLYLLDNELELYQKFNGDPTGEIQQARNLLYNSLRGGLHTGAGIGYAGHVGKLGRNVNAQIHQAKRRITLHRAFHATQRQNGLRGINMFDDPWIRGVDVLKKYEYDLRNAGDFRNIFNDLQSNGYSKSYMDFLSEDMGIMYFFNTRLPNMAHHLLYEFVKGNLNTKPNLVSIKAHGHQGVTSAFQTIMEIFGRDNVRQWLRNMIQRNNLLEANDFTTPEQNIATLKENFENPGINGGRIGEPATIVAVLTLLVAAIGGATELVNALKQSGTRNGQLLNQYTSLGTKDFSGNTKDWDEGIIGNAPNNLNNILPFLLVGAGGFLLLNDN